MTTEAIAEAVRIATIGEVGPALPKFTIGDRQIPIRVQLQRKREPIRRSSSRSGLPRASGAAVPLSSVANVRERRKAQRRSTATTALDRVILGRGSRRRTRRSGEAVGHVSNLPAAKSLPQRAWS